MSSQPTKRALLIGINYIDQPAQLYGCINDVKNVASLLEARGFESITMMHDELESTSALYPTRANILAQLAVTVEATQAGDVLFFQFSGHGSWRFTTSKEESDGRDECICPVDYITASVLWDDSLHDVLIKRLPAGCTFRALMDCCHSGTALDLRYNFAKYAHWTGVTYRQNPYIQATAYDAKMLSGCRDAQTSADAWIDGSATGALTHAFLECHENGAQPTCAQLLLATNDYLLRNGYTQRPELSSGAKLDIYSDKFL